jgi:hypothetical protein
MALARRDLDIGDSKMAEEFSLPSMDQGVSPIARVNHLDKRPPLDGFGYEIRQIFEFWSSLQGHETPIKFTGFDLKRARRHH